MGVRSIDFSACTGCELCVDICPMDVFRMDPDRNVAFIKYLKDCQSCILCELECPAEAIYVTPDRERRLPKPW